MLVEVFLKLLIGKVDVELLKTVHSEILEAKDVKDTHKGELILPTSYPPVDLSQDPAEQASIQAH